MSANLLAPAAQPQPPRVLPDTVPSWMPSLPDWLLLEQPGWSSENLLADLAELTLTALSDFVGSSQSEAGNHTSQLGLALREWAVTDARYDESSPLPPPFTAEEVKVASSSGNSARRKLGWSLDEFINESKLARRRFGVRRAFAEEVLECFVPRALWTVAARFIAEGPTIAKLRAENYLEDFATRTLAGDVSKDDGPPALGTLEARQWAIRNLMRSLVSLRNNERHDSPWLSRWAEEPLDWSQLDGPASVRDNLGVPAHIVRRVWQKLNEDVARLLRTPVYDFEAERAAVAQMSKRSMQQSGVLSPLYKRHLLVVPAVTGVRAGAHCRLCRRDLLLEYDRVDGTRGPALRTRPWKLENRKTVRFIPIPDEMAACLRVYLDFADRFDELVRKRALSNGESPLTPNSCGNPLSERGATALFGGRRGSGDSPSQAALLPKEGRAPFVGYSHHNIRSYVAQAINSRAGRRWLDDHDVNPPSTWVAKALLGHSEPGMDLLYGGARKPGDQERLATIATPLTWLLLTSDLGSRSIRDAESFERAVADRETLRAELNAGSARRRELRTHKQRLIERRVAAERAKSYQRAFDIQGEIDMLDISSERLVDDAEHTRDALARSESIVEDLLSGRRRKLIPDSMFAADFRPVPKSALVSIEKRVVAEVRMAHALASPHVPSHRGLRRWLSVAELAWVLDLTPKAVQVWLRRGVTEHVHGVLPWEPSTSPLTAWSTEKHRAIDLDRVNPLLFRGATRGERLDQLQRLAKPEAWHPKWAKFMNDSPAPA